MTRERSPRPGTDPDDATNRFETLTDAADAVGVSRRTVLSTAAVGAGGMALATQGGLAAQGDESTESGENGTEGSDDGDGGDEPSNLDVLNYALTLEHLENEFYKEGLDEFSAEEFRTAEVLCQRNAGLREQVPARLEAIQQHEAAHVETITEVIEKLGGEPVEAACYDFGYESASDYLGLARVFENTGVSAYDGAIHFFDNDDLATAGATIATVEARHASFLNTVTGEDPFPGAFDEAKSMDEIKEAIGQFIVECE